MNVKQWSGMTWFIVIVCIFMTVQVMFDFLGACMVIGGFQGTMEVINRNAGN